MSGLSTRVQWSGGQFFTRKKKLADYVSASFLDGATRPA